MDKLPAAQACQYEYSALRGDEIRLIRLQPGAFDDDLKFELVHHALHQIDLGIGEAGLRGQGPGRKLPSGWRAFKTPEDRPFYKRRGTRSTPELFTYEYPDGEDQAPISVALNAPHNYEALSYTWGDASHQQLTFVLDGDRESKILHVGRNLAIALRHLRLDSATRTLWVDAVCINQNDLDERAAQVKRMRNIYGLASKVLVWLGESSHDSSGVMRKLEYLGRQIEVSTSSWIIRAFDPPASEPSWTGKTTVLPYSAADWQAIESLFERSWFDRLWVLQEVTANPNTTVQCGHDSIDWYFLRRAIIGLDERAGVPATLSYRLNNKVDIAFGSRGTFRDVLFVARQHLCQDPRDKLYGVLGLIGPKFQDRLVPSYERPFRELYKEVFLTHSEMTGRLDLLTQCFVNEDLFSSPSWVPDWQSFPYAFRAPEPGYQASGASKADFCVLADSWLQVTGILIDKVIYAPDSSHVDPQSLITYIRDLRPPGLDHDKYVTGEPLLKAWTRTLAMDMLHERYPNRFFPDYDEWEKNVLQMLDSNSNDTAFASVESLSNLIRDTLTDMGFFKTEKGYIGFGPYALEQDDYVCVILGVPTPLVIRPRLDGTYWVIGWAYAHGVMDSEALLGPLPEGWIVTQRFVHLRQLPRYINVPENRSQLDDPRLGELSTGWRRIANRHLTPDDPVVVDYFENVDSGEIINYDPRMTADALRSRGVKLETLAFV
ncbi:hypothetical protein PRZ48_013527 [Zasmidium cellare]|uniref:Heterokaryon incompatibility domain-containing protein n=1 Tax=Zasmidium cellare TaxID=395010 RepID=A0ABR0E1B3_ZASCE|nr:hypothetical protein PRZ48_013527 [Zasmidium cellare]